MLARISTLASALLLPLLALVWVAPPPAAAAINRPLGYWLVARDGGIFSFGGAPFYGSMGGHHLNKPVVGMASAPTDLGYWEVASDGGIFAFGKVQFYGSKGGQPLNAPIVGMAATPTGGGYWEVASDGGIFAFGNAQFYGSEGGKSLNQPIVGMSATPTGGGYWEVARDGGIFTFGNAQYLGSEGGVPQSRPIVTAAAPSTGQGYWFANSNGLVYAFGAAPELGSAPQVLNAPIVGMAPAVGSGDPGSPSFQSGSYGYDVSNWQCKNLSNNLPPSPHQIGVVEVEGASQTTANPCLSAEAKWAAGGLNLYVYLTYQSTTSSPDQACGSTGGCNGGFNTAVDAFTKAKKAGLDPLVPWWLDVETPANAWSGTAKLNQAFITGAIQGLHYEGLNTVGIYASPGVWPKIVGTWQPRVPYWAAFWAKATPATVCKTVASSYTDIPSGPLVLVQYSSPSYSYAAGGMSTTFDDDYAC